MCRLVGRGEERLQHCLKICLQHRLPVLNAARGRLEPGPGRTRPRRRNLLRHEQHRLDHAAQAISGVGGACQLCDGRGGRRPAQSASADRRGLSRAAPPWRRRVASAECAWPRGAGRGVIQRADGREAARGRENRSKGGARERQAVGTERLAVVREGLCSPLCLLHFPPQVFYLSGAGPAGGVGCVDCCLHLAFDRLSPLHLPGYNGKAWC